MQVELPIWRLVVHRVATLQELETHWSLDDVDKANAMLDMKVDLDYQQQQKLNKG